MDLLDSATHLYGLAPGEFTATRNAQAKASRSKGDKRLADEIRGLRKPSAAAWVVNQLARRHAADLQGVVELGGALRRAQEDGDADEMRALSRRRQDLLGAVTRQGRDLAHELGHPVGDAVAAEVEQTLRAVMTDPGAAVAALSGRLVSGLATTGLAPVDVSDAVALPSALPAPDPPTPRRTRGRRPAAPDGRKRRREAEDALKEARRHLDESTQGRDELSTEVQRLRRQLGQAERRLDEADRAVHSAERQHDEAARAAKAAGAR